MFSSSKSIASASPKEKEGAVMAGLMLRVVDIGGDKIRRADVLVKGSEILILPDTTATVKEVTSPDSVVTFACSNLQKVTDAIIYACAGVIKDHSIIQISPNAHYLDGYRLEQSTVQLSGIHSCRVLNDLEAAAPGMAYMAKRTKGRGFACTWSSGFGGRILVDGKPLSDACEPGHMVVRYTDPNYLLCGCKKRGHAEAIIGGKAVAAQVLRNLQWCDDAQPGSVDTNPENPCAYLDQEFKAFNPWARVHYCDIANCIAALLTNIITLIPDLEFILWKGSFARHALPLIEEEIRCAMRNYLINESWADIPFIVVPSEQVPGNPDDDTFIGAALYLMD